MGPKAPNPKILAKKLPEWTALESILSEAQGLGQIHHLGLTSNSEYELPLIALSFGSTDPKAPVLGLFGGVHGLERIGAQVVLSLLKSFIELQRWDEISQAALSKFRIVFFPMINPLGMMLKTRSNPNGVDLMRNAPVEGDAGQTTFLVGGHYYSKKIPWYRGTPGQLEPEAQAVIDFCKAQFFESECVITLDFHSGFGVQDQLWFPYARTTQPFPHIANMYALTKIYEKTHPHHFYKIEPQAKNYTTHGDLWDYIYDEFMAKNKNPYIPLALEMGSWLWVKKNPWQFFSALGPFNPIQPHRQKRILRRHHTLFDFFIRSISSHKIWSTLNPIQQREFYDKSLELWYGK